MDAYLLSIYTIVQIEKMSITKRIIFAVNGVSRDTILNQAKSTYQGQRAQGPCFVFQAFSTLLQQVYRPDDEEKMRKTLRLMQRLSPAVSFWRFQCNNFKDDCFDVAYNALVKGQP